MFPLVAVSRKINEICGIENLGEPEIYYLGPGLFLESSLEREAMNFHYTILITGKWRRYFSFKNFIDLFKIFIGIIQALWKVWIIMPDVIFSKGGYGSVAAVLAGWLYRIPIIIHESDSVSGLANRLMAPFATLIAVSFGEAANYLPKDKTYFTGEAVRDIFFKPPEPEKERALLHLTTEKPVILVLGGSQGAQKINEIILDILPNLFESYEFLHQIGEKNFAKYLPEANVTIPKGLEKYYHPVAFFREQELKHALVASDLVIARAGSGAIFEIAAVGKPSIIIPLPDSAQGHQLKNAYAYAASGSTIVLEEGNTTPNFFLEKLKYLFSHPNDLEKMKQAALNFARPEAGKTIAKIIFNSLKADHGTNF